LNILRATPSVADAGLELLMRYPVEIRKAPDIDEEVTKNFLELIETNAAWKAAVRQ